MNNDCRLFFVDSAKGVGVILIVLGHMLYDSSHYLLNKLLYSFHVPLFFLLAGFVYHYQDTSKRTFIIRKARRLLLPFLAFSIFDAKRVYEALIAGGSLIELIRQLFYIKGILFFNAPLWFLIVLFEVYTVESVVGNRRKVFHYLFIGFLLTLGFIVSGNAEVELLNYFGFNRMIVCLVFFEAGLVGRKLYDAYLKHELCRVRRVTTYSYLLFTVIIFMWFVLAKTNCKVSIYLMVVGNYAIFITCAILGSIAVIGFCKKFLDNENVLAKLSKYSILILGLQYYFIVPYQEKMQGLNLSRTLRYDIGMIIMIVCIVVGLPVVYDFLKKKILWIRILNGEF